MSGRRPSEKWEGRASVLASVAISGGWHLLVLAVLALAIHPFQLPMQDIPAEVEVRLLPPLSQLRPQPKPERLRRAPQPQPQPQPQPLERTRPQEQALDRLTEIAPPKASQAKPLLDVARPDTDVLDKPVEVAKPQTAGRRLNSSQRALNLPPAPPAPLDQTRPNAPALPQPAEVIRTAPARPPQLDLRNLPPSIPQPAPEAQAAAPQTIAPSVLTNDQVIQAPVEIRPRERNPAGPALAGGAPATPDIQTPSGGAQPGGGQAGAPGGGPRTGPGGSVIGGFDASGLKGGGLRATLGCESPDTYKLTAEERAACLQRFGARARGTGDLGLNISAGAKAEFNRFAACQDYKRAPVPNSAADSTGTSIKGLGDQPTLKACGPAQRAP